MTYFRVKGCPRNLQEFPSNVSAARRITTYLSFLFRCTQPSGCLRSGQVKKARAEARSYGFTKRKLISTSAFPIQNTCMPGA